MFTPLSTVLSNHIDVCSVYIYYMPSGVCSLNERRENEEYTAVAFITTKIIVRNKYHSQKATYIS